MLTCIVRSKQPGDDSLCQPEEFDSSTTPSTKHNQAIKSLTSQLKEMALKASGAYRHCNPCTVQSQLRNSSESDVESDRFRWSYRRTGATPRTWSKKMEARLKGISSSSGKATPISVSGRRVESIVFVEENEPKEWVAQVESGVLITFVSLPRGGNDVKRIRFRKVKNFRGGPYGVTMKPDESNPIKVQKEKSLCLISGGSDRIDCVGKLFH